MPGGGKTTVGRALARRLGVSFADVDEELQLQARSSIAALFAERGEAGFRDLEVRTIAQLIDAGPRVIATGGGAVVRAENRDQLRRRTHCIYLRAGHELLWRRLRRDRRRPLLQVQDPEQRLRELCAERTPLYEETAHVIVDVDGLDMDTVLDRLVEQLSGPRG
jgi:shikimate kinase